MHKLQITSRRFTQGAISAVVLWACGCGNDSLGGVATSEVTGAYVATTFEREIDAGTIDVLALGGSITLTLTANGSTTGQLFVPAETDSTDDFVADLAGTWTLNGPLVRLIHASNSFLNEVPLLYSNGQLAGERATASDVIRVVLTRQST